MFSERFLNVFKCFECKLLPFDCKTRVNIVTYSLYKGTGHALCCSVAIRIQWNISVHKYALNVYQCKNCQCNVVKSRE